MRRKLSLLGLALGSALLLWSQPLGRAVTAGSTGTTFGAGDPAVAQSERPSAARIVALLQGLRPRLCRLTSGPTHALPAGALVFPDVASLHFSRQTARVALVQIAAGTRTLFPRAPPLSS
jgi:hypothetical protein